MNSLSIGTNVSYNNAQMHYCATDAEHHKILRELTTLDPCLCDTSILANLTASPLTHIAS